MSGKVSAEFGKLISMSEFKNQSTGVTLPKTTVQAENFVVVKLGPKRIGIEQPANLCQPGHHVSFSLAYTVMGKPFHDEVTAMVAAKENVSDSKELVEYNLASYDQRHWQKMLQELAKHHSKLTDLFVKMKGDEE